ncbi:NAD-dependent deacylase [Empedobacter brevis]|uniref:NAD-dependent protein deacylase n=2 Tax=Empedobacter brevis TaxID=247 RepID=A0A511NH63_9FLAO|nr:NAD-dependent deacylase [Empedobacter brevis]MDM1074048.1 NAD-dependent deacylase [Empedobacter brevis]QES91420.1 NAD-dependent deacylase [Empedobacter brevis]GEM51986.1 NAD-dependent protein deacylase [Empedobacter brevis NBRC 14943 = ATCC 43319]
MRKKLVVLTGAGISAESGISTFRDANGLWENHDIMEVASIEGYLKNPELVQEFYNQRRQQLFEVEPNAAHLFLKELESDFDVSIITQNVDDLHERANSSKVIHLHGELRKARSEKNENLIIEWNKNINLGDLAEDGNQLRPHIVWFGEMVPEIENAIDEVLTADMLIIIGTSMQVYPAASLKDYAKSNVPVVYIDPSETFVDSSITHIKKKATESIEELKTILNNF